MKLLPRLGARIPFLIWPMLIGGIAIAASSLSSGQGPQARKTTDPPTAGRGKMGQDLFLAIDHRDLAAVQALLRRGADPNSRNGLEFTPLHVAAATHQDDVLQALLSAGAVADAESPYGSPLTFAAGSANVDGFKTLLSKGASPTTTRIDGIDVLKMACYAGHPEIVSELVKRGVKLNSADESGATALHFAARMGNGAAGQILIGAGANVEAVDLEGLTPLHAAAVAGKVQVVGMLLKNGAKVDARDSKGRTALILATEYGGYPDVIRSLITAGADPKAVDSKGHSAAWYASARGERDCAKVLGVSDVASVMVARTPAQAVPLALKALQSSMATFSKVTNCISCHQEGIGRIATATARDHGFAIDESVLKAQSARIGGFLGAVKPLHEMALQNPEVMKQIPLIEINEVNTTDGWILAGMAAQGESAVGVDAMARVLARQQQPDGSWTFTIPRQPLQSSFFTFTALAVRALDAYAPKQDAADTAARIGKAKSWLLKTPVQTSEDRASKLLGLAWAKASRDELLAAGRGIIEDQRPDGGWSQLPGMASDAYATGQALFALNAGGMAPSDPVYRRGVQFLLRTQDDDGTWFVSKRAFPANNYFDAGFPHGESQFASFNGTCWAVAALAETQPIRR